LAGPCGCRRKEVGEESVFPNKNWVPVSLRKSPMTKRELFDLISRFAQRPLPAVNGRHVYLWHGSLDVLKRAIPAETFVSIDLRHLAVALPRAPRARDEARRLLNQTIQTTLNEKLEFDHQQIFVVTGCDLLSRYEVSLNSFFQLASEKHMIILVVPLAETQFQPSRPLPNYVVLDSTAPFNYLQAVLGTAATIGDAEL